MATNVEGENRIPNINPPKAPDLGITPYLHRDTTHKTFRQIFKIRR